VKRLVVDDGRINVAYKVISFYVVGRNPSDASGDVYGTLSLDYDAPVTWEFKDNRQIGWASTQVDQRPTSPFSLIDPDHIVVRDLYVQGQLAGSGGSELINYFVELEQVEISDDEAVLALIKERSQDDWR
jgi:hypothetical protein